MGSSFYLHVFMLLCCCFHLFIMLTNSSSSAQPLCPEDESSSLLQFKHSFFINKFASGDPSAYSKVESWKKFEGKSGDCCSWDGVECDHDSGHVVGLDLSTSFLYGSINSNSSLFNLVHLQRLNLSDNHFNFSQIPPRIGNLSRLTSLDIFYSAFFWSNPVKYLISFKLYGEFPKTIFQLPNLQILSMAENDNLTGNLLEFHHSSPLKELSTWGTSFSGIVPDSTASLGSVTKLTVLDLGSNQFWGQIPTSLGNLSQLTFLELRENNFDVPTLPLTLGKLSKLTRLYLFLANLTQLSRLSLNSNELVGQIPSWLMNLTKINLLELSDNQLQGMIPSSISQLKYLEDLNFAGNNLGGKVELDIFLKHRNLLHLDLSANKLTVLTKISTNATIPKFNILGLASCNLKKFPNFLQFQDELEMFSFSDNKIHGEIPTWFWNKSKETMVMVDLSQNFLTGFEQHPDVIPWWSLISLDLSFNILQGSLPIPPPSIHVYQVPGNFLSREIPPSIIYHNSSLQILDMSDNNLSDTIPECLSNFSDSLLVLNLGLNNFHDTIPHMMGST
ncbi:hypothetical protein ACSBR1_039599 [Camellia fascicularis]